MKSIFYSDRAYGARNATPLYFNGLRLKGCLNYCQLVSDDPINL